MRGNCSKTVTYPMGAKQCKSSTSERLKNFCFEYQGDVLNSCYQNERNMIKLQHFLFVPFLFFVTLVSAQTRTISGKVISSQDQTPIAGVTVAVKGTQTATSTGTDGTFSLGPYRSYNSSTFICGFRFEGSSCW